MSPETESSLSSNINQYVGELASALNFPSFEDCYPDSQIDDDKQSYLSWIFENYGRDAALKALILLSAAHGSGYLDYESAYAQISESEVPIPDVYLDEVTAASSKEAEILTINSKDELVDFIRQGLSSRTYALEISDQHVYNEVLELLNQDPIYFSTGNKIERLTPELIYTIFGDQFNFLIIHDTQGVSYINEKKVSVDNIDPSFINDSSVISSTEKITFPGDVIKETNIITDTSGTITETITYKGPWETNETNTVIGKALANGRSMIATRPIFLLKDPSNPAKPTLSRRLYALYTGGNFDKNGFFVANFKHEPLTNSNDNSYNYHGEVIAQVLLADTADIEKLIVISVDATGFYGVSDGITFPFIKLVNQTNAIYGANNKILINESISGASDRMNSIYDAMKQEDIDYQGFVYATVSAGNENKIISWESKYPDYLAQVVALEPGTKELKGLTGYSNYNITGEKVIGETGRFLAIAPIINERGELVYVSEAYNGTSMASPLVLGDTADKLNSSNQISTTLPMFFPDVKDIIFMGEINGGEIQTVGTLTDAILNQYLSALPGNSFINETSLLAFSANWGKYNGRFYKFNKLDPALNMHWVDFLRQQSNFIGYPRPISFRDFYIDGDLAVVTFFNGINNVKLGFLVSTDTISRIDELQVMNSLPTI